MRTIEYGLVELDGDLLVSYTQPYYYDEDGEWQANFSNTYFLARYDVDGDVIWETNLSDPLINGSEANIAGVFYRVTQMQILDDGNLLLSGTSGVEGILAKTNTLGELLWYQNYRPHTFDENPVSSNLQILYATPTNDGGYLMAGKYESYPGGIYPSGIQTAIALKVDEYGCLEEDCQVGIEEYSQGVLEVYPNPSSALFTIELPKNERFQLSIYNAIGDLVRAENNIYGERYSLDLGGQPNGIYLVKIEGDGLVFTGRLIKE